MDDDMQNLWRLLTHLNFTPAEDEPLPRSILVCESVNESGCVVEQLDSRSSFSHLHQDTHQQRRLYNMGANERLLVGLGWIYKDELRLFRLFPKVFHVDATSHTNNEKRLLLTFTGRTSEGQTFIFLRVFLPNQKAYSFRWVFQVILPVLLGQQTLKDTEYVISDGDNQECQQLDGAIDLYLPNARRGRCGWHIVVKGIARHCPPKKALHCKYHARYEHFLNYVKKWIFSWMQPGFCETEQEYDVSKALLMDFIMSEKVVNDVCGGESSIPRRIMEFITNYVLIYEDQFLFYRRKNIRHFNEYTNCAHEGTNFGAKAHSAQLLPSLSIFQSAKTMLFQSAIKCKEIFLQAERNMERQKLWTNTPTAAHLTKLGESIVSSSWKRASKYYGKRVGQHQWEVERIAEEPSGTFTYVDAVRRFLCNSYSPTELLTIVGDETDVIGMIFAEKVDKLGGSPYCVTLSVRVGLGNSNSP